MGSIELERSVHEHVEIEVIGHCLRGHFNFAFKRRAGGARDRHCLQAHFGRYKIIQASSVLRNVSWSEDVQYCHITDAKCSGIIIEKILGHLLIEEGFVLQYPHFLSIYASGRSTLICSVEGEGKRLRSGGDGRKCCSGGEGLGFWRWVSSIVWVGRFWIVGVLHF
jgi:hypothetical protein